jgi:hypothetical protein
MRIALGKSREKVLLFAGIAKRFVFLEPSERVIALGQAKDPCEWLFRGHFRSRQML